ncbi:MAG: hypothetical protein WBG50_26590 [Desulfomonilaceae bacterium]
MRCITLERWKSDHRSIRLLKLRMTGQAKRDGSEMPEMMGTKMRESLKRIEIEWGES